jgi:hypothetical protein
LDLHCAWHEHNMWKVVSSLLKVLMESINSSFLFPLIFVLIFTVFLLFYSSTVDEFAVPININCCQIRLKFYCLFWHLSD